MTGDKKDPTIDENLARIRELVESVKKPESPEKQDSGDASSGDSGDGGDNQPQPQNPTPDPVQAQSIQEGTAQNLARKGAIDSASRTPLTDYITENMPEYLDTPARQPSTNPNQHVEKLPTADNGFNEPFTKASVSPIDDDVKPAPFVTGVSSQQIKPREQADSDDEIPQTVMDTLLQSDEKGKVHIRSGVNAPAFTSPHNVQLSINRENRRTLEEIAKNPPKQATISEAGNAFSQMQPKQVTPENTAEPLVLTDVLVLEEIVPETQQVTPSQNANIPDDLRKPAPQPQPLLNTANTANSTHDSGPDESVLVRIRTAMEHLKQTQIDKQPFDTAVRDMVETEVRPMVKQWVNDNIADVVERQVDTEIQKILNKI